MVLTKACDSDEGGKSSTGDPNKTSYDINVEGGSKVEGDVPKDQASEANGGASIADGKIHLFLVGQGSLISVVIQTDEGHKAPGTFAITSRGPEPTFANLTDALAGASYESTSGAIKITTCPTKIGDKLVGELQDVVVESVVDQSTRTLDGSFDLHVYAMVGTLACGSTTTNPDPDPTSCEGELCADGGVCCPYVECITECEFGCVTQDPSCSPFTSNPQQCAACMYGCLDECNVSGECRDAYNDLDACGAEHGCSGLEADEEEQCLREHCCDELGITF